MDGNTESSSVSPEALRPETDFAEYFHGVISKLYDLKHRPMMNNVKSALRDMRRLRYEAKNFHRKTCFSFKPPQVRCAYMYAYSVLHSIMVYSEFSNLLKENKMFLLPACRRGSLKICCLGGGPGIEAVAICTSINDMIMEPYLANTNSLLEVHVTMIDKLPHWRREESAVVNAINDSSNVLHSERIILHSDFMRADLLKPFENNLREKIMEADIVTVVKLAVSIQENSPGNCDGELQIMMENTLEIMREDSCLFMLDTAGGKVFSNMVNILRHKGPHSRTKTSLHKKYSLDVSTIEKFENMMKLKKVPKFIPRIWFVSTHGLGLSKGSLIKIVPSRRFGSNLECLILDETSAVNRNERDSGIERRPVLPTVKGKISACMWVKNISIFSDNSDFVNENNVSKMSNITNIVFSTVQREKDSSSATHSSSDSKTSNGDIVTLTNKAQNIEPLKMSKRAMKKAMKRKVNKKI